MQARRWLPLAFLLPVLLAPLAGQASAELATAMGCLNCHGTPPRADAPAFTDLAARWARRPADAAAEQHVVDEIRSTGRVHGIQLHERVSTESARQLVHWLLTGAR